MCVDIAIYFCIKFQIVLYISEKVKEQSKKDGLAIQNLVYCQTKMHLSNQF